MVLSAPIVSTMYIYIGGHKRFNRIQRQAETDELGSYNTLNQRAQRGNRQQPAPRMDVCDPVKSIIIFTNAVSVKIFNKGNLAQMY